MAEHMGAMKPTWKVACISLIAFLGLIATDFVLKFRGFQGLHRLVKSWPVRRLQESGSQTAITTCGAVDRAARHYFKRAWCLQRSVVTACLLRIQGVPAQLVIGCKKMPFIAHAWVEVNGTVVNDDHRVQSFYVPLDRL